MAVTITVDELLAALRLGTTDAEVEQGTRLLAYCDCGGRKARSRRRCPGQLFRMRRLSGCRATFSINRPLGAGPRMPML